jgi:hypothetical protein
MAVLCRASRSMHSCGRVREHERLGRQVMIGHEGRGGGVAELHRIEVHNTLPPIPYPLPT